jgi:hypothetical protein
VPLVLQVASEPAGQVRVVLDDENALHRRMGRVPGGAVTEGAASAGRRSHDGEKLSRVTGGWHGASAPRRARRFRGAPGLASRTKGGGG